MSSAVPPEPFLRVLRALVAWLRDTKAAGVLVGGVAVPARSSGNRML